MYIDKLRLTDYRNYTVETVSLDPGLNVICGRNAAGKTNLIESMYLLGVGRSPRTTKDKELVRFDAESAYVKARVVKKYGSSTVEIMLSREGKRIAVDSIPIKKLGELMGVCPVVFFSPDELKLVKDAPMERRRFMDVSLSQQSKGYYYTLLKYNKILAQRNKLLKSGVSLDTTLPVWDVQLADVGAKIIEYRLRFVEQLKPLADEAHRRLTDGEALTVEYEGEIEGTTHEELVESLMRRLSEVREKEEKLCFTCAGPHRDDLTLRLGALDVKKFGSQGQQRTVSLSLKLAEVELFRDNTGEYPVLLLDDVLSELDEKRRSRLIEATCHVQTVITCTEYPYGDANVIRIKDGKQA